jgi:hypothetical protein
MDNNSPEKASGEVDPEELTKLLREAGSPLASEQTTRALTSIALRSDPSGIIFSAASRTVLWLAETQSQCSPESERCLVILASVATSEGGTIERLHSVAESHGLGLLKAALSN